MTEQMHRFRKIRWAFVALAASSVLGCATAPVRPPVNPPPRPIAFHTCIADLNVKIDGAGLPADPLALEGWTDARGDLGEPFLAIPATVTAFNLHINAGGADTTIEPYQPVVQLPPGNRDYFIEDCQPDVSGPTVTRLAPFVSTFPPPLSREEILKAHESFQGSVLHTTQFGDLNWWPPAWVSLSDADRAASYAQIASWGDTDITVVASWHYGEPGQPYGAGQLVPDRDFVSTGQLSTMRSLVKEVLLHKAANGKPFVPVVFAEGDNGFSYYMWAMPQIIAALKPQPGDPIDLAPYVLFRMCYDSCVPGWQPPSQVDEAILATRAACPNCVISMEFSSGYPCWGGGDGCGAVNFQSPAGQALDNVDWEGNSWPPNNWEQYYEVLGRLLGQAYHRPPEQVSDPDGSTWYLRGGTPRGPWGVHCLEPFTYQWVRDQVPAAQVPIAFKTLSDMGCPVIDMPVPR